MNMNLRKKLKLPRFKYFGFILLLLVIILVLSGSFYTINEQEEAVLTTFGAARPVTEPGLHFKIPYIQKVQKVNATINGFSIGYDIETNAPIDEEAVMITSDYNFVNIDFFVEYKVSDPVKAVYSSRQPVLILKNIAQGSIRSVIGSYCVDDVLTTGKNEIQAAIKELIIKKLKRYEIGIRLVNITIQDSQPPTREVMEAFKAVETAKQRKETAINNANKYRNEKLPEAMAETDKIVKNAQAQKQERINEANGQVARFNAMYAEYVKNPAVTRQRMYYEAMEDVLPSLKVIINVDDSVQKLIPLEPFVSIKNNSDAGTFQTNNANSSKEGD